METFLKNLLVGISTGSAYSLVGLGIVIIYKSTRIFNFAIGSVTALGSFIFMFLAVNLHLDILSSIILTMVAGLILGFISERIFLRPMIGQPLMTSVMMTLAVGVVYEGVVFLVGEGRFRALIPLVKTSTINLGEVSIPSIYIITIIIMVLFFLILSLFFKFTKIGLGMRAAAEDHKVAQSKGVVVTMVFGISWGICLLICCLCGIFLGAIVGSANHLLASIALKAFPVVLCGGLESFLGCMIMGPTIGIVEIFSSAYMSTIIPWTGFDEVSPYLIMFLIMLFKPEGLFGLKRIERI